jgi:carboxyl-terminal processing protease
MRLDDVVQKIRGKKGSVVRLEVIRAEATEGSPNELITLVRDKVILEERAAKSDTVDIIHDGLEYRLGVIDIPTFYIDLEGQRKGERDYKSTTRDVRRLIQELQSAGVEGIIIDLRRNGGGSLQEAIELTGLFIKEGPVVQVKNSAGRKRVEYDPDHNIVYDGPIAVMVSRFSASASEIFASAIQDYGRGVVLGNQTYGKGTVQNLLSLDRFPALANEDVGQIKVTVAKFYRITGGSTQHRGVLPDIRFPSIYDEMDIGENKQFHALPWSEISPTMFKSVDNVSLYVSRLRLNSKQRTAKNREFQYILEDIEHYKLEKAENSVSLVEEARKTKRSQQEDKKMARANERITAKGLEPLEKGDKITPEGNAPDAVLEESQLILADFIAFSDPGRRAELTKVNTAGKSDDETTDIKNKDKDNSKVIVH